MASFFFSFFSNTTIFNELPGKESIPKGNAGTLAVFHHVFDLSMLSHYYAIQQAL